MDNKRIEIGDLIIHKRYKDCIYLVVFKRHDAFVNTPPEHINAIDIVLILFGAYSKTVSATGTTCAPWQPNTCSNLDIDDWSNLEQLNANPDWVKVCSTKEIFKNLATSEEVCKLRGKK